MRCCRWDHYYSIYIHRIRPIIRPIIDPLLGPKRPIRPAYCISPKGTQALPRAREGIYRERVPISPDLQTSRPPDPDLPKDLTTAEDLKGDHK